jgi:hypothetical protein
MKGNAFDGFAFYPEDLNSGLTCLDTTEVHYHWLRPILDSNSRQCLLGELNGITIELQAHRCTNQA